MTNAQQNPARPAEAPYDALLEKMRVDKKSRGSVLRFVVLDGLARPTVLSGPSDADLRGAHEVLAGGAVDLVGAAPLIGRTAVVDTARGIAALGVTAADRGADMTSLRAPDFTVGDMRGEPVSLSDFRGKKVVLFAWSSW